MRTPKRATTPPRVPPARHKMALLTWPGAWALITLILWGLGPTIAAWPLALRTLAISALMVVGLTWAVIPVLTRTFAGWLGPTPQAPHRQHCEQRGGRRHHRQIAVGDPELWVS